MKFKNYGIISEQIGFEVPVINEPVTEEPIVEESVIEESTEEEVHEKDVFEDAEWSDDSEIDIDQEIKEFRIFHMLKKPITITQAEQKHPLYQLTIMLNRCQASTTSIEIGIERLHSTRFTVNQLVLLNLLSRVIVQSNGERVERTLMVMDSYRGGMTVVGFLDNGPYTVAVLFEPNYNEQIEIIRRQEDIICWNTS